MNQIFFAMPGITWPGGAAVTVSLVGISRSSSNLRPLLSGKTVDRITPYLDASSSFESGDVSNLYANKEKHFNGSKIYGSGFLLSPEEAGQIIRDDPFSDDVIFKYLTASDLTDVPDCASSGLVINFGDMTEEEAAKYTTCFAIVRKRVYAERMTNRRLQYRKWWWRYAERRVALNEILRIIPYVLVTPAIAKYTLFCRISSSNTVFDHNLIVLALPEWSSFTLCQSSIHLVWSNRLSSTVETRSGYRPSDCFENFPFPVTVDHNATLTVVGELAYNQRLSMMSAAHLGSTDLYNIFHDPHATTAEIRMLRDLHVEMDRAVVAAYEWYGLQLNHGFHETKQGTRFTISESARQEVLSRLVRLNHERYAEEIAQGLHDKKGEAKPASSGRGRKTKAAPPTPSFLDDGDDDPDPASVVLADPERTRRRSSPKIAGSVIHAERTSAVEPVSRPTPIDEFETDEVMAAFRQASRGRGWTEREDLLKEVSLVLGYQRLGPKIEEALRNHLRAAIRRRIVETDGPNLVHPGAASMADYELDELRETFRSVMRKDTFYEREDVIHALASYLGFVRVTDSVRQPIRSAINSAIRQGSLGYQGTEIWRQE